MIYLLLYLGFLIIFIFVSNEKSQKTINNFS